jgi:hypothetical protein
VWTYFLVLAIILGSLLALSGIVLFLARFRGGRFLKPLLMALMKVKLLRRLFEKLNKVALEKQNPELASVHRKLERLGAGADPMQVQRVIARFSRAERRAYDDYVALMQEQGMVPEAPNRQLRRKQQRVQPSPRAGAGKRGKRR